MLAPFTFGSHSTLAVTQSAMMVSVSAVALLFLPGGQASICATWAGRMKIAPITTVASATVTGNHSPK